MKFDAGAPLAVTAERAKGYDMTVVAILERPEDVVPYGLHPAHQEWVPIDAPIFLLC